MELIVLPKKLNDQYKFIDALEEFVYENPKEMDFLSLLEKKRISGRKLRLLAQNNDYVAEKIENIKEVMSGRWLKAWTERDSDHREKPAGDMFRYYNREYDAFVKAIGTAAILANVERAQQRSVINVISDPVERTEAVKAWKESQLLSTKVESL
jgi:hypothetical protein